MGLVVQQRIGLGTCFGELEAREKHKNTRWSAGSHPSWQWALASWIKNHCGRLGAGEEDRVDRLLGLSDWLASPENALAVGNLKPAAEDSQAHEGEDSQPPPLQEEDRPTPGQPAAEGEWCRAEGVACPHLPGICGHAPQESGETPGHQASWPVTGRRGREHPARMRARHLRGL